MKAVVFHGIGDIRIDEVDEPRIEDSYDAIVRITGCAICGTDLHMIRGTLGPMSEGTILGHEGVGIVEEVGDQVRNLKPGDRVVIPSTIACGYCSYCRAGYYSQCDHANPNGKAAGTAFFGGPQDSGPFHGMQAEYVRVPFANIGLVKIHDAVSDNQALMLSDIFPTGYFAADNAEITNGDTVAVFGCGPVGQFSIISAFLFGASRVIAVDKVQSRLDKAKELGAEAINFEDDDPVKIIQELTGGIGVDRAIDAVGVDAEQPHKGPAQKDIKKKKKEFEKEIKQVAPEQNPDDNNWIPGDAPSLALDWSVKSLAKAGTLSIVGVYSEKSERFPIGIAMNKNLAIHTGNCNHRKYIPLLMDLVQSGTVDPERIISKEESLTDAIEAYKKFDERQDGWLKVSLNIHESHMAK